MSDSEPAKAPPPAMSLGRQRLLILFASLGVAATLFLILFMVAGIGRFALERGPEPAPVVGKTEGERFGVAATDDLPGTGLLRITIATEGSSSGGDPYGVSSRSDRPDIRNLILLDKASGVSRRLLPDNSREIVAFQFLPAVADGEATVPETERAEVTADARSRPVVPAAYYLLRVRAGKGPSEDVLLGDIKSGRQGFVLTGIDGIDRVWMQTPTRLAMLLRQGRKLQYRAFDLPALKLVISRPIEID